MLKDRGVDFEYREYRSSPLTREELVEVLGKLGFTPRELLREKDAKKLGLPEDLDGEALLDAMAEQPTLVQRPIAIDGDRAILARPAEELLRLLEDHEAPVL